MMVFHDEEIWREEVEWRRGRSSKMKWTVMKVKKIWRDIIIVVIIIMNII